MHKNITKVKCNNLYRFGVGEHYKSSYAVTVPILIAGAFIELHFDVVEGDVPLLLGKDTLKKWKVVISAEDETASLTINGKRYTYFQSENFMFGPLVSRNATVIAGQCYSIVIRTG